MNHTSARSEVIRSENNLPVDSDWKNIIDEMALVGLVKELAGHCALKSHTENKVTLSLSPNQEHLLNPNQKVRLENAIKTHFGDQVTLYIEIEDPNNETPAETKAREERERQKTAEQSVKNDPIVKVLEETFNAKIEEGSIQPI